MSDQGTSKPPCICSNPIFRLVLGIVVFGVLIGLRTQFQTTWVRALVAACAGAVLGWVLLQVRKIGS